jgi:hypothetical protein
MPRLKKSNPMLGNDVPAFQSPPFDLDPTENEKLLADLWERLILSIEKER